MKPMLFFTACFFMIRVAIAQKEQLPFGRGALSELELKDCSFDPGAEACKLIDFGSITYNRGAEESAVYSVVYERRTRIKILRKDGLAYASLNIRYDSYNNNEKIISINACTYTLTEAHQIKKTIVPKNAMYNRRINKQYSELILVFPDVKVGSVIEYKCQLQCRLSADVKDWYFQSELPSAYSEYQVRIPEGVAFTIHPLTAGSLAIKETRYTDGFAGKAGVLRNGNVQKNFVMRNLPAIREEPFTSCTKDYMQRLSFRLSAVDYGNGNTVYINSEWEDVVDELLNDHDFGGQLAIATAATTGVSNTARLLATPAERVAFIYDYVKQHLQWNGKKSVYSFEGIKKALQQGTGSSGDINLLLVSMLKQAGIHAAPILFSTRDNGLANESLPLIKQFNTVMAVVEDGQRGFVLDAADPYGDYGLPPAEIVNTKGFIVEADSGRWLHVTDSVNKYKVVTAVSGILDSTGMMKGDVWISSSGYARKRQLEDWINTPAITQAETVTNEQDLSTVPDTNRLFLVPPPLEQKLQFRMAVDKSGDLLYFNMNRFSPLETNPFTAMERRTDIDFAWMQEYKMFGSYIIPSDYEFEDLPQNISLIMPDTSIVCKRFVTIDNNSLNVSISVDFRRTYYSASTYNEFAAFYKLLQSTLNEQVIIKKKKYP